MGSAPGTIPPAADTTSAGAVDASSKLKDRFTLFCVYHGAVGDFATESDALAAAAKHITDQHAGTKGVDLEITTKKVFTS